MKIKTKLFQIYFYCQNMIQIIEYIQKPLSINTFFPNTQLFIEDAVTLQFSTLYFFSNNLF